MKPLAGPPADFDKRPLPTIEFADPLYRIHRRDKDPVFFGRLALYRFDAPDASYGVLYTGTSVEAAFAEVFLRDPPCLVSRDEIAQRYISRITLSKKLVLLSAYGADLAKVSLTSEIGTCDYKTSRAWSAAIHAHPQKVDGIFWAGRHDNATRSIAIFERAKGKLVSAVPSPFDDPTLANLAERYQAALI